MFIIFCGLTWFGNLNLITSVIFCHLVQRILIKYHIQILCLHVQSYTTITKYQPSHKSQTWLMSIETDTFLHLYRVKSYLLVLQKLNGYSATGRHLSDVGAENSLSICLRKLQVTLISLQSETTCTAMHSEPHCGLRLTLCCSASSNVLTLKEITSSEVLKHVSDSPLLLHSWVRVGFLSSFGGILDIFELRGDPGRPETCWWRNNVNTGSTGSRTGARCWSEDVGLSCCPSLRWSDTRSVALRVSEIHHGKKSHGQYSMNLYGRNNNSECSCKSGQIHVYSII